MGIMDRTTHQNAMLPGLFAAAIKTYKEAPKSYQSITKPITARQGPYVEESAFNPFGTLPVKTEGAPMSSVMPFQGFVKRYTAVTYAAQLAATQEALEDDRHGILLQHTRQFSKAAAETVEVLTWDLLNSGFDEHLTDDGQYVFDTDHTFYAGSREYSNESASGTALSVDTLWTAINAMRNQTDAEGNLLDIIPNRLCVPIQLQRKAREILGTMKYPDDDRNAINPLTDFNLEIQVSRYLTSSTAWFLTSDQSSMKRWFLRPVTFGTEGDFTTQNSRFRARFRYVAGVQQGMGIYGNEGA
jgi:phage major head subunit gpT-like protein